MDIREKIAELIRVAIEQYRKSGGAVPQAIISRGIATEILSLPVEGCGEVEENCLNKKCSSGGTGFISRPLTLGELPELARKMREELGYIKSKYTLVRKSCNDVDEYYKDDTLKGVKP